MRTPVAIPMKSLLSVQQEEVQGWELLSSKHMLSPSLSHSCNSLRAIFPGGDMQIRTKSWHKALAAAPFAGTERQGNVVLPSCICACIGIGIAPFACAGGQGDVVLPSLSAQVQMAVDALYAYHGVDRHAKVRW